MAQEQDPGVADDDDRPKKRSETLSQFVARVLGQLSLVAWLPSGALVLSLTFVFQFNAVLDGKVRPKDTADAIGDAFSAMTRSAARSRDDIARFFDGLVMLAPGLVSAPAWRPDHIVRAPSETLFYAGIGR